MNEKVNQAIEILKQADYKYIKNVLKNNKHQLFYDTDFGEWTIEDKNIIDYFFEEENTYLNPKELKGFIEEIIDNEIFPIKEIASDFISYFESKYGLEDITEDRICSNITKDCEFYFFEVKGLSKEVIKQLKYGGKL